MGYPTKYRERTIEYRKEDHTLEETRATFEVSISTIRKWEKQLKFIHATAITTLCFAVLSASL